MRTSAVAGLTLAAANEVTAFPDDPQTERRETVGHLFSQWQPLQKRRQRNRRAKAFKMMTDGSDVLDAVIAGVNIVELDPLDDSVGYGGLPNADGVVQLDSSVHAWSQEARRGRCCA